MEARPYSEVLPEGGAVTVLLEAVDSLTPLSNLNFTVVTPPEHGTYTLVTVDPPWGSSLPRIGTLVGHTVVQVDSLTPSGFAQLTARLISGSA